MENNGTLKSYGTLDQMSNYLINGYWDKRSFDISESGSKGVIKYNVTGHYQDSNGISAERANLVRAVFNHLENMTGIDFQETKAYSESPDTIYYTDTKPYAFANINSVNMNPSFNNGSSSPNGYMSYVVLHETLHVLGLGHQGPYNYSGNFDKEAIFVNDSMQISAQSYFTPSQNPFINASFSYPQTMMSADVLAIDKLYGSQSYSGNTFGSSQAFKGDTVYGFNTNISTSTDLFLSRLSTNLNYQDQSIDDGNGGFTFASDGHGYTIADGSGTDTFDFSGWSANQYINLTPTNSNDTHPTISNIGGGVGNLTLAAGAIIENARGGSGNDTILGNGAGNSLSGNGGNDTLRGYGGNDTLIGGTGNDKLYGYGGDDTLRDDSGADIFNGGAGSDTASYFGVRSSVQVSLLSGSNNQSDKYVSIENVVGSNYAGDRLWGNKGANSLSGEDGNDVLAGDAGNDRLYGGAGNDKLYGGAGDDYLRDESGKDYFNGGAGIDTVSYYGSSVGMSVSLASGGNNGGDRYVSIENVMGSNTKADSLTGSNGANTLWGLGGDDRLYGGAGNDKLFGGDGNDYLRDESGRDYFNGGAGTDTVSYLGSSTGVTVNLTTGGNNSGDKYVSIENVIGSNTKADIITGSNGANTLWGLGGNDNLYGGGGNDKLYGGDGDDYLRDESGRDYFNGGAGKDTVSYYGSSVGMSVNLATGGNNGGDRYASIENVMGSNTKADTLTGSNGANKLWGLGGDDRLYGGAGNDRVDGGVGADVLDGGAGRDALLAGHDNDRDIFVFRSTSESGLKSGTRDSVYQFDSGEDDIDLHFIDANTSTAGDQAFSFSTAGAAANSVWLTDTGADFVVYGDVNGDKAADFSILVAGLSTLTVNDFIL